MSIPASYREVPGSNTGHEACSAGLKFRIFPRSLTKKFRGGGGGGDEGGGTVGCGDMMMAMIIIIIIIIHLSPVLKKGR